MKMLRPLLCAVAILTMMSASWAGVLKITYPALHTGWVIETPNGKVYVIDPGLLGEFYDTDSTGGMGIGTYLKKQGVTTVNGMMISHPHGDHYDAGVPMFQDFNVLQLIDTGFNPNGNNNGGYDNAFWSAFQASSATRRTGLRAGDTLSWDPELTVKVLGPKDPFWTYAESNSDPERHFNQNSLVLWLKHGENSFMFTGDITPPAQNYLRTNWPTETRATTVLGIPHHGKWYYHDAFANALGSTYPYARVGVISEDHTEKGSAADMLDEWQGAGLNMYAGDGNNEVTIFSTGGKDIVVQESNPAGTKIFSTIEQYGHQPFFDANGANFVDLAYAPGSRLTNFSVGAWFRTTSPPGNGLNAIIVGKGGFGSEAAGQNMNYGIWMTPGGQIEAGFETATGANVFATSTSAYNNGQWHHAVVTYGGGSLKLYIDGAVVDSLATTALPDDGGTSATRIGADSSNDGRFFTGDIDDVRVWNRAVSAGEISNAYNGGRVNLDGIVSEADMACQKLYGTNFFTQIDTRQLRLTNFTVEVQFRTTAPPPPSQVAMIVNKGGFGSDAAGENMNYGIWIDGDGHLVGGFEAANGDDYFATSATTVNDGQWHTANLSFNGSAVVLKLNDVQIASTNTTAKPDTTGTHPLRIGANSRSDDRYFTGEVDYVTVFNPAIGTVYWNQLKFSSYTGTAGASAPSITTQPASQTVNQGDNATFTVTATGTAPMGYQWTFNGANISGATASSYTRSNVQSGHAGNYAVTVSNAAGNVTSANALLTVIVPPVITTHPASQTVNQGDNATFTVTATGTAPLGYQWTFNGANISGATASSYTRTAVQSGHAGNYAVTVSNSAGSVTSANAVLTVIVPPVITTHPASQTVNQGDNATFTVTATGTAPLGYQWTFNGANISGATASSYTRSNVQGSHAGNYAVVVSNAAGTVTSANAVLTVIVPPSITTQPANQTVDQGANATFTVTAAGTAPLAYQWKFNGANLSGATTSSYTRSNAQPSHQGNYSVVVSNGAGSVTSANASLTVKITATVDNSDPGFSASANWSTGTSATDKYGTNYRFRNVASISDTANWSTNLVNTGSYAVSAWWSQGANRSITAPYIVYHSTGSTTVYKNQQANGGSWQSLGIFALTGGTNTVKLSCWTTNGTVVIADAVRWVQQ